MAETDPEACADCGSTKLTRSTDVLDTWFSSALWPFATLGWPDDTEDLRAFYPGDLNTTARDIIRLWENRMIFSGLELMGDVPFTDVVIHSTVHAPTGGRMSKSLGTGMNPLAVIDAYGADAMRYGLMKMASAQDVRFSEGAIEEGRKLANKLWNVARLIIAASEGVEPDERPTSLEERWILARLSQTQRRVEDYLDEFDFSHVVGELYHLTFDDFCDWYAESVKGRLYDGDADARATATAALERLLKLLHPAMPHVTEEIWTNLPSRASRLIVAPWPEAGEESDASALVRIQEAAEMFRRSSVRVPLEGDELRIFEAVVRPARRRATATPRPRSRASARRSRGRRACSRTSASCRTLRPRSSRRSGRSSRATSGSSMSSAADYVESSSPWPRDGFGLDRIRALLRELGDPQRAYPSIHVVGTNGKSTVTRTTEELLAREGLVVGAYFSPHVRNWSERIRIGGDEADFERAVARVRPAAERLEATQFELLTAAALVEFAESRADVAVVEAGLGGRHDATNVLESPIRVLTNISLEHTDVLGTTREAIAAEKLAVVSAALL